jgi:hypothetical protein
LVLDVEAAATLDGQGLDVGEAGDVTGEGLDDRLELFGLLGLEVVDEVGEVIACGGEGCGGGCVGEGLGVEVGEIGGEPMDDELAESLQVRIFGELAEGVGGDDIGGAEGFFLPIANIRVFNYPALTVSKVEEEFGRSSVRTCVLERFGFDVGLVVGGFLNG